MLTKDLFDVAVAEMSEKLCELMGVPCPPEVLEHWNTAEGREALNALRPQLQLLAARALTHAATPIKLKTAQITDKGAPSFLRAALDKRVSPKTPTARPSNESNNSPPSEGQP